MPIASPNPKKSVAATALGSRVAPRFPVAWEEWALRAVLLITAVVLFAARNVSGALVALEGLAWTLLPLAIQRFGRIAVPRSVSLTFTACIALQFVGESIKLFEIFYYWDKIVHPLEVALATAAFAWLLLGYVDTYQLRLSRPAIGALSMLIGATLGTLWEFIEFLSDWFGNADLQKSNADTMTDVFSNDVGAYLAALGALWLYHRALRDDARRELGHFARWLTHGPGRLLERRGALVGAIFTLLLAALVLAAWLVDRRPIPPVPAGQPLAQPRSWNLTSASIGADVAVLDGDWQPDPHGLCRVNLDRPRPGSERPGLLSLAPDSLLGPSPFVLRAHYLEVRPPLGTGTQMTAGIAFGIRDARNFYVLEASTLHDVVRLDRYVHGTRRDVREERVRTRGDEWHDLEARVERDRVTAVIDGRPVFTQTRLRDVDGQVGLWARATATACFQSASASPLSSGA